MQERLRALELQREATGRQASQAGAQLHALQQELQAALRTAAQHREQADKKTAEIRWADLQHMRLRKTFILFGGVAARPT